MTRILISLVQINVEEPRWLWRLASHLLVINIESCTRLRLWGWVNLEQKYILISNKTKYCRLRLSDAVCLEKAKSELRGQRKSSFKIWAGKIKIESFRQTWTEQTDGQRKAFLEILLFYFLKHTSDPSKLTPRIKGCLYVHTLAAVVPGNNILLMVSSNLFEMGCPNFLTIHNYTSNNVDST